MAYRYFRGRIDFGGLSLADLSKATEALAVLEQLAADGRIGFEMGVGRTRSEPRQAGRPIQPQERAMLEAMPADTWMSSREIAEAMPELPTNSLTARLAMMAAAGWIVVSRRENADRPPGTRGRRSVKVYRRSAAPSGGTVEDPGQGPPCADVPDGRHREEEKMP
ncbi:hypothetical protein [Methylorubrum extorquens]|uniref:Uncharacterized protein n=1 Tax=Methylorubrum extorquens (strain ATCC 14718 / DSM 1338 / JCM 2805 / NCIMB 9133 / AM1) TaxID=272630 RepID=C5B3E0_METEA|nr:hypothetical protein [Methylorubrum extorquens]ACS42972.1 Hypothetical protein MexAM1_META2p0034 [Methylorubrum extorquens AM1]MCP1545990.1 hypothetical protein [Methylorubrum extorquens]MCP1590657.1 hypothetical protein [Methylorubrum extorquens]